MQKCIWEPFVLLASGREDDSVPWSLKVNSIAVFLVSNGLRRVSIHWNGDLIRAQFCGVQIHMREDAVQDVISGNYGGYGKKM